MKSFVLPLALCAALGGCAAYVPAGYATYPAYPGYSAYSAYPAYPAYPAYGYGYGYAPPVYSGPMFGFSYYGGGYGRRGWDRGHEGHRRTGGWDHEHREGGRERR